MPVTLYEHPVWQQIPGENLRPGGLTVTARALSLCDLAEGARFLDVGCGPGATLDYLTSQTALRGFGVDLSDHLLHRGPWANPAVSLAQAHGERLPFAEASFEAVFAECTLSLFNIETALPEWARILQPGGYLLVNDLYIGNPAGAAALRQLPPGSCLQAALPRAQILENIAACGLELLAWEEYPQALKQFPACTLSTAAEIDPFDLIIAATRAQLGYYLLAARKVPHG